MTTKEAPSGPAGETISVAMCTFNGAHYLPQQLNSILGQTSPPDELVVCDDGSEDETVAVLSEFAARAPFPVHVHRNAKRLRFSGNFAKCIGLCGGDIIVVTDQDDEWMESRVEETRAAFAANPALTFTFSDAPLMDGEGKALGSSIYSNFPIMPADRARFEEGADLLPVIARWGFIYGCTMAFRAGYRSLVLPVPETWSHDEWITLVLSAVGPSKRQPPVTRYRQHSIQSVGVGDWSLQGHLRMAKRRDAEAYDAEMAHYEKALAAARPHAELTASLVPVLEDKLAFLRRRQTLRSGGLSKLPTLLTMISKRDHWHYGAGLRSVFKDAAMLAGLFRG